MDIIGKKINFLGDSITEGCGTSLPEKRYTDLIAKNEGAICRNYGISGTRIAKQYTPSGCPSFDKNFNSRVAEMDPDADVVIVFGGTNDYGHGDAPLGKMSDRTIDTFYGALHCLYRSLMEKYINADIIILTPLHRCFEDNVRGDGYKASDVGTLHDYVKIIREVAEFYSLPVLDLYAASGLQPDVTINREKYFDDGLHPNDNGHIILAKKIVSFLKTL